jgi:hypothetical protein
MNNLYQWFSPGTSVSSINKTDRHNITEILLNCGVKHKKPIYIYIYIYTASFNLYLYLKMIPCNIKTKKRNKDIHAQTLYSVKMYFFCRILLLGLLWECTI